MAGVLVRGSLRAASLSLTSACSHQTPLISSQFKHISLRLIHSSNPLRSSSSSSSPTQTQTQTQTQDNAPLKWRDIFSPGSRLQKLASENPTNLQAQLDLFDHLYSSQSSKDRLELINRYEELTQIWKGDKLDSQPSSTPTPDLPSLEAQQARSTALGSDQLFRLYLRSLVTIANETDLDESLHHQKKQEELTQDEADEYKLVWQSIAKVAAAPAKRETLKAQLLPSDLESTSSDTDSSSDIDVQKETSAQPSTTGATLSSSVESPTLVPSTPTPSPPSTTPSPRRVLAPSSQTAAQPQLSTSALISALFSNNLTRGKGGQARVISAGATPTLGLGSGKSSSSSASGTEGTEGETPPGPEPIRVIVEEAKSPWWQRAGKFVFVTALYSFLILSLLSLLLDSSGIMRATSQASPFTPTPPPDATNAGGRGTTFKDVHGVEEAKGELYEVVEFLKDPKKFEKLGGRLPRGVLLTGPPGTGKTLLARAVAGEAGVNFFTASGSEFDEMYVGVGARRIRELFKAARKAAPAIIFIDELDAIGGKRSPRDQHYVKQTLNQLLVELDGFSPGEGVILLGATNFPESLDKALIRPGRFDCHIVVPLPDVRGRMKILQHHMKGIGYDKAGVDISTIARGTIGFSGADLQALVNQAAVKASADNASSVRAYHFEWAKERIMMGAARKSAYISDKDKLATAYHEGGHALVALYTAGAYPLQSVTVVPRGNALGYTLMLPEMDKSSHTLSEYRAKLDVAMGGRVAEELIYGKENVTDGASSDIQNATSVASNMVRRFGFSDKIGPVSHPDSETPASPETQALIESEVRGLIEAAQGRAMALLKSKKTELERLARALVEHETLDLVEVQKICKGEKIAKPLET